MKEIVIKMHDDCVTMETKYRDEEGLHMRFRRLKPNEEGLQTIESDLEWAFSSQYWE